MRAAGSGRSRHDARHGGPPAAPAAAPAPAAPEPLRALQDMEFDAIRRAVDEAGGNISVASKRLGISRNTIYRKLRWQVR